MTTTFLNKDQSMEKGLGHGVIRNMKMKRVATLFVTSSIYLTLLGCPRVAYIEVYNNTSHTIKIDTSTDIAEAEPAGSVTLPIAYSYFHIEFNQETWRYNRNIPHDGSDGPYFDGTLRIQINSDKLGYALETNQKPPVVDFEEQPTGYPIEPDKVIPAMEQ
ncbi:hypothetical protein E4656_17850 [Natronospirillum operosum]|uniref:Uncharacterized protein n=1 Tax=Natronospirillum operosum TaxID=2759953 RepID=A0A4Z0W6J8_9GAMM|nr:hypothetical protein [Natronospirillum operosum]TGG90594.1 hypothetical protein E4656_17850 [Natronospirillum operosum]